jgi:hypothetical protein
MVHFQQQVAFIVFVGALAALPAVLLIRSKLM